MVNQFCVSQNAILANIKCNGNKISTAFESKLYRVIRQKGSNLSAKYENGQTFYPNVSHVRPYYGIFPRHENNNQHNADVPIRHHIDRKLPQRFDDFIV